MKEIQTLFLEDSRSDVALVQALLEFDQFAKHRITVAERLSDAFKLLDSQTFDVALTDLSLPDNKGLTTFNQLHEKAPSLPIIVLTGLDDSETARKAIQAGAQDYLPKNELTGLLLTRTMLYAIERKQIEIERNKLITDLQEALAQVKTLSGLLPICAYCKKVRDDSGYWKEIDSYLCKHTDARFSHGFCPECAIKFYEENGMEVPDHVREMARQTEP